MLLWSEEKEGGHSDGGESIATEEGKSKKKTYFEVHIVPLHYTQELLNEMTSILGCKADHVNVSE